ncbi:hypothetical protein H0H93_005746 [Arthromyces matolae]|nr:hypothetical protein H0H93_005746 [Arthromyces matolae]
MASLSRRVLQTQFRYSLRTLSTSQSPPEPTTHYKITLRRSAISLGDKIKATLVALGLHRRHQTVYQRHTPEAAGKILRIKELVEVENVPTSQVKTPQEMRLERKATRGYKILEKRRAKELHIQA